MKENELISRYANGELNEEQRTAFEKRLGQEPALRSALALYRDIAVFSDIKSNASLQNTFEELGTAYFGTAQEKGKVLALKRYFIAAAAIFLLAFGVWWLMTPHIRLYKQVAHTELSIATKKGNAEDIQKMESLYNNGHYEQAIPLLWSYSDEHPKELEVRIALCVSLIEEGRYDLAHKFLTEIKMGDSAYKWEATFYLALLNLKQGNMEDYHKYLDEIPTSSPVYKRVEALRK